MEQEALPKLRVLTDEEAKEVVGAFEEFKKVHGVALNAVPFITDGGTIDCQARFFKVVESPKAEAGAEQNGEESKG